MKLMNRYAIIVEKEEIDTVLKNVKRLGGKVSYVSCSGDKYMILYRAEEEFDKDVLLKG